MGCCASSTAATSLEQFGAPNDTTSQRQARAECARATGNNVVATGAVTRSLRQTPKEPFSNSSPLSMQLQPQQASSGQIAPQGSPRQPLYQYEDDGRPGSHRRSAHPFSTAVGHHGNASSSPFGISAVATPEKKSRNASAAATPASAPPLPPGCVAHDNDEDADEWSDGEEAIPTVGSREVPNRDVVILPDFGVRYSAASSPDPSPLEHQRERATRDPHRGSTAATGQHTMDLSASLPMGASQNMTAPPDLAAALARLRLKSVANGSNGTPASTPSPSQALLNATPKSANDERRETRGSLLFARSQSPPNNPDSVTHMPPGSTPSTAPERSLQRDDDAGTGSATGSSHHPQSAGGSPLAPVAAQPASATFGTAVEHQVNANSPPLTHAAPPTATENDEVTAAADRALIALAPVASASGYYARRGGDYYGSSASQSDRVAMPPGTFRCWTERDTTPSGVAAAESPSESPRVSSRVPHLSPNASWATFSMTNPACRPRSAGFPLRRASRDTSVDTPTAAEVARLPPLPRQMSGAALRNSRGVLPMPGLFPMHGQTSPDALGSVRHVPSPPRSPASFSEHPRPLRAHLNSVTASTPDCDLRGSHHLSASR